ncbi:erythromycin esterase family protein [Aquimarina sp. TRL1]|uniref:erythromycin esterase family protein n=1 Tax=Aquimarina sp. (strain TRL1) TaxID=2736252 RepID=UPI00158EB7F2|nr:erythromycin esterase family protein [Aquimarina sp. TRL1]QKX06641.1 erythromycin esterase family protein [Aquimarina sp. TRL1]
MNYKIVFFFTLCTTILSNAQHTDVLKKYAIGFDHLTADSFSFLDNELTDIRIVGYGEDTHGTSEFTILAKELMHYLSEKQGFKICIIETGFGEGQYLNDYIQGKRDDLKSILDNHNTSWRYETKEFIELMNQLKEYNQNHLDKIHLYGCEMQIVLADINRIREYLSNVGSEYQIDGFEKHIWQSIEDSEKTDYYLSYIKLKKHFENNYEEFIRKTSERKFNIAYQHIMVLGQFVTAIHQTTVQRKHDLRDMYMAENIQWILNLHGEKSKALYWAHNSHVGDWVSNGIVDVAGHQLRKVYGSAYYAIATDFGTGEFLAYPFDANRTNNWNFKTFMYKEVPKNTFSYSLKQMGTPNTFLKLRKAKTNPELRMYLEAPITTVSGAGARARNNTIETNELGKAFDAIIYLDKTNPINWIK